MIDDSHWDLECPKCKITRGFQLISHDVAGTRDDNYGPQLARHFLQDYHAPITFVFRCPVCKTFKLWMVYEGKERIDSNTIKTHYYRVTSIPAEGLEEITELPEKPESLRAAYRQAIRAMDGNALSAAAAMFRRAVQVITRELIGVKPGNLGAELHAAVGKTYNGVTITHNFANVGYIIKEAGNQGAHPDADPDLLDFTPQDASDLRQIFMELVSDLFVVPAAVQKAKADFLARRKIVPKPS
jgi:hypothetical protein